MKKHVVVIGGGLAGAAAAYWLNQRGHEVTVIEKNDYIGGRVHTHMVGPAPVEMGAAFLTSAYTNVWKFLRSNDLADRPIRQRTPSGIYRNGKTLMVKPGTLLGNAALSWGAKLHAVPLLISSLASWHNLDLHAFWKAAPYDNRSVADTYRTRGGNEFLEYVLQPVLNGYFYWTPEHTSRAMIRILVRAAFSHATYRMRGGLQRIPEAAIKGSTVLLNTTVTKVLKNNDGSYSVTTKGTDNEHILRADGIVCATTASAVSKIFPDLPEKQREFFDSISYSSGALVAAAYDVKSTNGQKSIAFPRRESIDLSSISIAPDPQQDNPAFASLRVYASGTIGKTLGKASDKVIARRLFTAMEPARSYVLIGNPAPLATHVQRWPEALPCFDVGHFKRLLMFRNGEIEDPAEPVVFAGDYIGGPFMEGAYTSGMEAADRLSKRL